MLNSKINLKSQKKMKLFKLEQIGMGCVYDQIDELVICAENEKQAREMANKKHWDEGEIWNDPQFVSCEEINSEKGGIILISAING